MRGPEGAAGHQSRARRDEPGQGVELRDLDGLLARELRQEAGQTRGEHGFPRTGRSHHEDVVTARRRQLQGAPGQGLAAHVAEVRRVRRAGRDARRRLERARRVRPRQDPGRFGEGGDGDREEPSQRRLPGVLRRDQGPAQAALAARRGQGQHAARREHGAVEAEFAQDEGVRPPGLGDQLARHGQHPQGHGEVQMGALLLELGRRQPDHEPAVGEDVAGVAHRSGDPIARLAHRPFGQAHDAEARQPARKVGLHAHQVRPRAPRRRRPEPCQHTITYADPP